MTEPEEKKPKPAEEKEATKKPDLVVGDALQAQAQAAAESQASNAPLADDSFYKTDTIGPANPAYSQPGGGIIQRRSRWYSSLAALRYVNSLSKDDDVRVRDSDRATSIFLLISAILTVVSLLIPQLAPHRIQLVLVCDALVGMMLVFYVANRFGILNTLSPRQALLTWQLLMGASFLGIFMTINFALIIALVVSQSSVELPQTPPPHAGP